MIRRITLENYMSHVRTAIEPAEGLTAIVGPNNCGKSAIVSALQTLCENTPGDFMVRHGCPEARVTVETDDGHVVSWRRRKRTVSYEIDGREVHRLGKGNVPDDLHELLRLPRVADADREFDVHFGHQKEPVFLIDRPGRDAAVFFASTSDAILLMRMQAAHEARVLEAKKSRRRARERIGDLDREISALDPVCEERARLEEADEELSRLVAAEDRAGRLEREVESLAGREGERAASDSRCRVLEDLGEPPDLGDDGALERLMGGLGVAAGRLDAVARRREILDDLEGPPDLADATGLERIVADLEERRAAVEESAAEVAGLDDLVAGSAEEIRAWASRNPTCPTCGAEIDAEALLGKGSDHGG